MSLGFFTGALGLTGKILSVTRKSGGTPSEKGGGCALRWLSDAMAGETLTLDVNTVKCPGGKRGFGFTDEPMAVPGGYANFVSNGAGEGAPPGMRLKKTPAIAEEGAAFEPDDVLEGYPCLEIKAFEEGDEPDLVCILANPDQLSALNLLFHYAKPQNAMTVFPSGSGCSTLLRLPFAELKSPDPRAFVGNADVSSRIYFGPDTLFFTVSGKTFASMLEDAPGSFLAATAWKNLSDRA